jgi:hypothetical protein
MTAEANFPAGDDTPGLVRDFITQVLDNWGVERAARRDALVLATEVTRAAIRTADVHITVYVRLNDGVVEIEAR